MSGFRRTTFNLARSYPRMYLPSRGGSHRFPAASYSGRFRQQGCCSCQLGHVVAHTLQLDTKSQLDILYSTSNPTIVELIKSQKHFC